MSGPDPAFSRLARSLGPRPERPWHRHARPAQLPPPGDWRIWLCVSGRGWGKTRAGAEWLLELAMTIPGDYLVLAGTFGSARDACSEGGSGLLNVALPGEVTRWNRSLGELALANGSRVYLRSADEPDRLRGFSFRAAWCDELSTWRRAEDVWHAALLPAVRLDPGLICVTTTPRPLPLLRELLARQDGSVAVVRGSTWENEANLSTAALHELKERYEGTRLGRQELGGELLEDIEGALWNLSLFEDQRVAEAPPCDRVVVAVDPAVTSNTSSDETGIVVAGVTGRGPEARFFVLADESLRASPHKWASRVVNAYHHHKADRVVVEVNQGGDLVESTLQTVAANLPTRKVRATRGKQLRAEPVVSLYEQGRVHHVGVLAELEEQATTWIPGVSRSPDRVDALVYALTDLAEGRRKARSVFPTDGTRGRRRPSRTTDLSSARYPNDPLIVRAPR